MISFIVNGYRVRGNDYATPLMRDVRDYEPDTEIVLVDCNSDPHYTPSTDYHLVRVPEPWNPARCLNLGAARARGEWLMLSNDDVTCSGKFARQVEKLDPNALYAIELALKDYRVGGFRRKFPMLNGWMVILHRDLFARLGPFNENDIRRIDVDYSMTAIERGIPIKQTKLPFKHLDHHRRG